MLARARQADDSGPVWDELWSHLCHQGTVASASYAAIGALTDICLQQRPRGYIAPLQLVGAIVAAEDGPEDPAQVRRRYARELAELAELAEQCLPLSATDADFLYGLETWMALAHGGPWSRCLGVLGEGEALLDCPNCRRLLVLRTEDEPVTLAPWEGPGTPTVVDPVADPEGPGEAQLIRLATVNGRRGVAAMLRYAFGSADCSACGSPVTIGSALDGS
ncbi:hypothetical protein CLV29_3160 [Naumannella halotolerans]|uniref:Uncharacterized protein n=1 Tax=Naumannella halotolerans TaxID=993414 RepID=A0A4R7IYM1_9ACTN|nr:hypothetical protein CLV29_3160 [Naumannella halotolerans]